MKNIKQRVASIVLCLGLSVSALPVHAAPGAEPDSAIEKTKKQIVNMTEKIRDHEDNIEKLQIKIQGTTDKIKENEGTLAKLAENIATTMTETDATKARLAEKEELYATRLREHYKSGEVSVIKTLISSKSVSDFFAKYEAVKNIAKHDQELMAAIEAIKAELEEKAQILKKQKAAVTSATEELKENKSNLVEDKKAQEGTVTDLKKEKTDLKKLLKDQEVELFAELERILTNLNSTEAQVTEAMTILEAIRSQVSTPEAVELGRKLAKEGSDLKAKLVAARLEAERLAKEKAEAERQARIRAKKKQKAEAERLRKIAAEKEAQRQKALARAKALEAEKKAKDAEAKRLAAEEKAAQEAAEKAIRLAKEERKSTTTKVAVKPKTKAETKPETKAETKPRTKAETKSETKAETKPRTKAETKPETKAETKPRTKAETKPRTKAETKPSYSTNRTFELTFYTDLPSENGGWTITATGDKLVYGIVASNVWPLYTKIYLEGYGTMTVKDRGGSEFYSRSRLDVFIPRRSGESSSAYLRRVNMMGRRRVQGRVLK